MTREVKLFAGTLSGYDIEDRKHAEAALRQSEAHLAKAERDFV
jgi:hypothetical protein